MLSVDPRARRGGREPRAPTSPRSASCCVDLVRRGEDAVERTPAVPRMSSGKPGSSTRAAPGLLELVRGVAAAVSGEPLPEAPSRDRGPLSSTRSTTSRPASATAPSSSSRENGSTATARSATRAARRLAPRRRRRTAIKVHVHTDDPGAALSLGSAVGTIDGIEIANMHEQSRARGRRSRSCPTRRARSERRRRGRRGRGNRRLFESSPRKSARSRRRGRPDGEPVYCGPARGDESLDADEAIILPNNSNIVLAAEHSRATLAAP